MLAQLIYLKNEVRNRSGGQVFTDEKEDNQKKMRRMRFKFLSVMALFLGLSLGFKAYAQPKVIAALAGNKGCLYQTVPFTILNAPANGTAYTWNFGDGQTAPSLSPATQHFYGTAGAYVVVVTITTPSGPVFSQSDTVYINNLPKADFVSTNGNKFCNPARVCFKDNSQPATPLPGQPIAPITKEIFLFGDGGIDNNLHVPPASRDFCYTYPSPDYNVYTQTIRVIDLNGCMDTLRRLNYIYVVGDLGVNFTVNAPIGCAQNPVKFYTKAFFTNTTRPEVVYPDSVKSFRWDFGDGQFVDTDPAHWDTVTHYYFTNGSFSPRLIVEDINGCRDTMILTNGVKNTYFAFDVDAIENPICANPGKICWKQTNVAGASKLWTFFIAPNPPFDTATKTWQYSAVGWKPLSPDPKIFTEDGTFTPCRTIPCGMARASLKIRAPGCFDTTWVWDTVEVLGPDAQIETPGGPAVVDSERYQCKVVNPVHFTNLSCHYKAWNVERLWDFGDRYARQCTTDTKNGINVTGHDTLSLLDPVKYPPGASRPCNCNFSRDSLPVHVYTDWDTLALRSVAGSTFIQPTSPPYSTKNFSCYTVKLMLYDSVNHCGDTDQMQLPLGPPKAGPNGSELVPGGHTRVVWNNVSYSDPTTLKKSGIECFGAAPNGIIFDLSKTVPSCTRGWVCINYDSAAGIQPNKWVCQPAHFTQLNNQGPWVPPPAPRAWPNKIAKNYFDPPGLADTNGFVTVGLITGNGWTDSKGNPHWCYDTAYYHQFLRFTPFTPVWDIVDSANGSPKVHDCIPMRLRGSIRKNYQDSLLAIIWNWQDGYVVIDSILRVGFVKPSKDTVKNYTRTRYYINPQGTVDSTENYSFVQDTIVGEDTLVHYYTKAGRYFPSVTMVNTAGCVQFYFREIVAGFYNEVAIDDTVVCVGDTVNFRDSAYYWIYPEPIFPPKEIYYVGRDPFLGGYRTQAPAPPYQFESLKWRILKRDSTTHQYTLIDQRNGGRFGYSFNSVGLYSVELIVTDSMGCKDTARSWVTVIGIKPGILVPRPVFACNDTVRLYDQSIVIDPYYQAFGIRTDSIMPENKNGYYWEFGDGKTPSPLKNPVHDYTSNDSFIVYHKVKVHNGCTADTTGLVIIDGPRSKFKIVGDSIGCVPFAVTLDNQSNEIVNKSKSFIWYFGDPNDPFNTYSTNGDTNITKVYTNPGTFCIYLLAKDKAIGVPNFCPVRVYPDTNSPDVDTICVKVLPVDTVHISVDTALVCLGDTINIDNSKSGSKFTTFDWYWGDGINEQTGPITSKTHIYADTGVFTVRVRGNYTPPPGERECKLDDSLVVAIKNVKAIFEADTVSSSATALKLPLIRFVNKSENGVLFDWYFGHPDVNSLGGCDNALPDDQKKYNNIGKSFTDEIRHCYGNDTGWFKVCMIAYSQFGCVDSMCIMVHNNFDTFFRAYNVFTPGNGDGKNDVFNFPIKGQELYELTIYNRWGEVVFESDDPNIDWNGKLKNSGAECPAGTYYWVLHYKFRGHGEGVMKNTVTLIRE